MRNNKLTTRQQDEGSGTRNNTAALFVSLYLVVLAFFILLNSISKIQEKLSEEAVTSVRDTFSNVKSDKFLPIIKMLTQAGSEAFFRNYYAPIKKIAQEAVTLVNAEIIEVGNTMKITIPVDDFFVKGESFIRPEQEGFILKMTKQMQKVTGGKKMTIEFVIGYNEDTDATLGISRASEFANKLLELGVEKESVSVGLSPESDISKFSITFGARNIIETPKTEEKKK